MEQQILIECRVRGLFEDDQEFGLSCSHREVDLEACCWVLVSLVLLIHRDCYQLVLHGQPPRSFGGFLLLLVPHIALVHLLLKLELHLPKLLSVVGLVSFLPRPLVT